MIIKKPYAFLIKNFRIIHAILFIMLTYLAIKTYNIYSFYNSYATNHYFVNSLDLAATYINYIMFIAIVLSILVSLLIYYILKIKNKEGKYYIAICLYYIILFISYIIFFNYFQDLQYKTMDFELVRILRDISLILTLPQLAFVFVSLGRTLGFNIRQFDFKKDLEELQIDKSDYEEVEITLGKNNYKYKRLFRKSLRHIKYFVFENKFFVTIIGSVFTLIISLMIFVRLRVYNVNYSQKQQILANTLWYTAQEAYITNQNLRGEEITKGKYYLLIRVNIDNRVSREVTLDRNTFKLKIGKEQRTPKFNLANMFLDIGKTYAPLELEPGASKEYIVVYELNEDEIQTEYILRIKNLENISLGQIETAYKDVIIRPYDLNSDNDTGKYTPPIDINLKGTTLYNTKIHINKYSINKTFKEYYEYCEKSKCYNGTYVISPTIAGVGKTTILKIASNIKIDNSIYISKFIDSPADLFTYFATLSYRTEGVRKNIKLNAMNIRYGKDKNAYFEVPKEVEKANKIDLIIQIRGIKYTIILK